MVHSKGFHVRSRPWLGVGELATRGQAIVDTVPKLLSTGNATLGPVSARGISLLACPTVGCMPHSTSEEWVRNVGGVELVGYMDWLRFAFLATVTGLPAISIPVGLGPRGLPVGLQLIGKPRGEAALLAAARFVEKTVGGPLGPIDPI